jgi:Protein of unknown function, DUF481
MSDRRLMAWVISCACALAGHPAEAADKVDVVHLKNGDRITCEIKNLDKGLLEVSTDPAGKLSIHWGDVASLESPREFEVEVESGTRNYGSLAASPADSMVVSFKDGSTTTLPMIQVIRLTPIGASIWSRMDGSVDSGFSFTQANVETHLTLNASATYRGPLNQFSATLSSQLTNREDVDRQLRNTLTLSGLRNRPNRWFRLAFAQFQQNDELSLELRTVAGGGLGRAIVQTNHRQWSTFAGVVYTHEQFTGEEPDNSAEAAAGGILNFFTPGHENFDITTSLVSYTNISGRKRIRLELQSAWSQEFLSDFYWSFNGFDSYDSTPPDANKTNDFGVSFTIGWKF